jgi:uracil-DNA glycosylase
VTAAEQARRRALLATAPHMAPLVAYVERLRALHGADRVPDLDPVEAGVHAGILLLLEAPGPKGAPVRGGSGFASADNASPTSRTLLALHRDAGTDRAREVATWNVVPWYLGDERRIRAARSADLAAARPAMVELLGLLPRLRVVVLLGRAAASGWQSLAISDVASIEAPHPSPQNLHARPEARGRILEALRAARRHVEVVPQPPPRAGTARG